MQNFKNGTWLADEAHAYNTYSGAHTGSARRAVALCPDGKARKFTAGVPDTFFSIPCHGKVAGRYVAGFLSINTDTETLEFTPDKKYREIFSS